MCRQTEVTNFFLRKDVISRCRHLCCKVGKKSKKSKRNSSVAVTQDDTSLPAVKKAKLTKFDGQTPGNGIVHQIFFDQPVNINSLFETMTAEKPSAFPSPKSLQRRNISTQPGKYESQLENPSTRNQSIDKRQQNSNFDSDPLNSFEGFDTLDWSLHDTDLFANPSQAVREFESLLYIQDGRIPSHEEPPEPPSFVKRKEPSAPSFPFSPERAKIQSHNCLVSDNAVTACSSKVTDGRSLPNITMSPRNNSTLEKSPGLPLEQHQQDNPKTATNARSDLRQMLRTLRLPNANAARYGF